jgi:[protein-PII] uridylyltransferase
MRLVIIHKIVPILWRYCARLMRLFSTLRQMKRYGVLGQYLPAFGAIIGQMQYDLFHIYTVDAHTLLVIKNMRRFRYDESA